MNKKNNIRVLSLDTSSNISGWAFFINGKLKKSGIIDLSKIKNTDKRTKEMCLSLRSLIVKYSPTHIVIEQLPSTRNVKTTRLLSRIIGCVYFMAIIENINYIELSCLSWRSAVEIKNKNRKLVKLESIKRVLNKHKLKVDDNEADAINIGDAYFILKKEGKEIL